MKKITFSKIAAGVAIAAISISTSFAQQNLGAECGCPPVNSRPAGVINMDGAGNLLADQTFDCGHLWTLPFKVYVPNGRILTIEPGTVIKGAYNAIAADQSGLFINRGGKIMADGTKECPIVFTSVADPMDGTHPLTNVGEWGGVALFGIATNNLITSNVLSGGYNGVGYLEGFSAANPRDLYGAGDPLFPTANENDNSGVLRYVSIRHAGAIIALGNELNALALGSVGRGTTIEYLETIANADDNIEWFGGTVNVKYASVLFSDDDMFDYDQGWTGKCQFMFGIQGDSITGVHSCDNGFEADTDDDKKAPALHSHPVFYNVTLIGNGHVDPTADNSGPAAIQAKELVEGEIYNSIFAGFRSGLHLATGRSNATDKGDAYDNWTNAATAYNQGGTGKAVYQSLKVKNNTFVGFSNTKAGAAIHYGSSSRPYMTVGSMTTGTPKVWKAATVASTADSIQFFADGNTVVPSVPGFDIKWAWNNPATRTSYSNNPFHATPTTNIASTITPPADGFFSVVNYRGAFDANKGSWLSEWALNQIETSQSSNPTDLNNDGITSTPDFNIFVGKFGQLNQ